jgi:hypothetical protein
MTNPAEASPMTEDELLALVDGMMGQCVAYDDNEMRHNRVRALEYYRGEMRDLPAPEGRSSAISKDVRAALAKIMPSLMRTFAGGDRVVEYVPRTPADEPFADQATDYVNYKFWTEWDGYRVLASAFQDALLLRNGVLKHWWDERIDIVVEHFTSLTALDLDTLTTEPGATVIEEVEYPETDPMVLAVIPDAQRYDIKLRREKVKAGVKIAAVPGEQFLIDPETVTIEAARFVAHRFPETRSNLIARGFDREVVDSIPAYAGDVESEVRRARLGRSGTTSETYDLGGQATQVVEFAECYARVDFDGDGFAELRRICIAGYSGAHQILSNEEWDEIPFSDLPCEIVAHRWQGFSLFDDIEDVQKKKTALVRGMLDNIYWQNAQQPIVDVGAIEDPSDITNPEFGKPIRLKPGRDARAALAYNTVPFTAQASLGALEYLDREATDRTGISDASASMDADALQNQTATASRILENASTARAEMIARTFAETGLRRMFAAVLRLIVKHQPQDEIIRLRNTWVTFSPSKWNPDMDASVNTGLGAGSRERDMALLTQIGTIQKEILASMGVDNPLVTLANLSNTLTKFVAAAGLRTPELYFQKPTPEAMAKLAEPKPDRQAMEAEAKLQFEREEIAAEMQQDAARVQAEIQRDITVEQIKAENAEKLQRERLAAARQIKQAELETQIALAQASALRSVTPQETQDPAVNRALDGVTATTNALLGPIE